MRDIYIAGSLITPHSSPRAVPPYYSYPQNGSLSIDGTAFHRADIKHTGNKVSMARLLAVRLAPPGSVAPGTLPTQR